ncbi:MAG: hypothetical protein WAT41_02425 [Flavobacteriales bacterium]
MKFTPTKEKEKFFLPNFLMDNLIVFGMCGVIAFIIPMWANRRHPSEKVLALYNNHDQTRELRNVCMIIAGIAAIIICYVRLKKFHLYSLELKDHFLLLTFFNTLGQEKTERINLFENKLRIENLKETRESDRGVAIKDSYNNVVLSTEKSKYWNYRQDRRALDELTRLLKEIKKP